MTAWSGEPGSSSARSSSRRWPSSMMTGGLYESREVRLADQPAADILHRLLGRGEPDPLEPFARHVIQPFEGERQVRPAPGLDHGVDLVDDDGARGPQHVAAALGGQEQVQRLGRGDENVWRGPKHRGPLGGRRVAGAYRGSDVRRSEALGFRQAADLPTRLGQVLVDVRAQGLERRDVDHLHFVGQLCLRATAGGANPAQSGRPRASCPIRWARQ